MRVDQEKTLALELRSYAEIFGGRPLDSPNSYCAGLEIAVMIVHCSREQRNSLLETHQAQPSLASPFCFSLGRETPIFVPILPN